MSLKYLKIYLPQKFKPLWHSAVHIQLKKVSNPAKKILNFLGTPQYRLCPLLFHHTITSAPMLVYICSRFPLQECCERKHKGNESIGCTNER